jgi:DNA replication and repair protein RecF
VLHALRLQAFRCFESLACGLAAPGDTVFVGDNAQGKTSLLEAACVLMRLQSPRTTARGELVKFGHDRFGVAGEWGTRSLRVTGGTGHLDLHLDGVPVARPADYLAAGGLVVWMGNEDLNLVCGPGEARRRYLDFLGAQTFDGYLPALRGYQRALRARNRLLKSTQPDLREIGAFTEVMARTGDALVAWRHDLFSMLPPLAAASHGEIDGGREQLDLNYHPDAPGPLASAFARARESDLRRHTTTTGPHRDEFTILIDGRPAAKFASEGQQRTIALALKLAQAHSLLGLRPDPPLLLIDDIFGELDPNRRNRLLNALPTTSQRLITTTHLTWATPTFSPNRIYHVHHGSVTLA